MNEKFVKDYEHFCSKKYNAIPCLLRMMKNHELAFFFWGRQNEQAKMKWYGVVTACILHYYRKKYGFEINFKNVGGVYGLYTRG